MLLSAPQASVFPQPSRFASRLGWTLVFAALTSSTLLIHGFHPFAEDGGLYAAGVEYTLDPQLFPHDHAFVTAHLRFSLFAPVIALVVQLSGVSLHAVLVILDLAVAFCTLLSARALLRRWSPSPAVQVAGLALLAAGWSLPIAGTSLYLMDPYVTARSFCMPAALLAIAFALDVWRPATNFHTVPSHPAVRCCACLLFAAVFHPLMATYAFLFVAAVRATSARRPVGTWILFLGGLFTACALLEAFAPAEGPAEQTAVVSRYYWFLSQWHWYERLGLAGPLAMFALVLLVRHRTEIQINERCGNPAPRVLVLSSLYLGLALVACALLFARESAPTHMVARLQPLRGYLLLYTVMLLILGAEIYRCCDFAMRRARGRIRPLTWAVPAVATVSMALGLYTAARQTYPASPHVEWPWLQPDRRNAWVQAFVWARDNTPADALFALDSLYVNQRGQDAQVFRAIGLRSSLPDFSKDGGEASITPSLADAWRAGASAQRSLDTVADPERRRRLQSLGVTWVVLKSTTQTAVACPYANAIVKVCHL